MDEQSEGEHVLTGLDEEAIVDHGKSSFTTHTNYEREDLESHRAVYVGVHVPLGRESKRRHRHRGHKHHRKKKERDFEEGKEDGRESPTYDTPSQRVQFILGTEDDDLEHVPHDLFTELDELSFRHGGATEWKETARWLKFEEDVEDGGERWSKPYVATLSLHSLFELRSCILNGTVMLDMRVNSIEEIADMLIDNMVASGQLKEDLRHNVREAMLKKHHHQNERKLSNRIPLVRSFADIGKKHSDPLLLERNGEGLSSSRLSLHKPGAVSSVANLSQRRESRVSILLHHLLPSSSSSSSSNTGHVPGPALLATPQNTPSATRRSSQGAGLGPQGIPAVVVSPPEDDDPQNSAEEASSPELNRRPSSASQGFEPLPLEGKYLCSLPVRGISCKTGPLLSPNSVPSNLDGNKSVERRPSKVGVSRESSSVDFSKVDMNFMKKIPPGAEASNVLVGEVDFLEKPIIAFVRLSPAVLITGLTEVPVPTRFLFLLLGPHGKGPKYHEIGRSMATLMTDEIFHDVAYKAKDRTDLLSGIDEFLDQVTVLPPGEWDPTIRIEPPKNVPSQMKRKTPNQSNGSASRAGEQEKEEDHAGPELQRTGRIFGGLILDIKRKLPFYWSDIRDSFSLQCLASVLFLYCACMSPVITFGGLLGEATKGNISAIESLFGASLTGVVYSLFAGQPLTILGSTGPVLVFEKILFKFCTDFGLSYLSLRTSIGLWTAFMCLVLVATDASSLVCYITRFTEEAFAALICIIFIYEALEKLFHLGEHYPVNMHNNLDNLTLYSCQCSPPVNASEELMQKWNVTQEWNITGNGSDSIPWSSLNVSQFKTERYFPTRVRSTISDFAVFITIMVMVLVDYLVGIPSPKLNVPDRFEPTSKNRGWLMDPLGDNPWWTLLVAALPALLCTILIFMDQQITAVIINRKEHKLKKGCGYHLDLTIVAIMLGVCSIMGLPWFVAATVLSISHVNSLKVESGCSAPGEQPKFLGIREQRVTGFMIFALMGCSVFMTSVLKFIPMPVLYGVFLYMGVSSLKGIQFFDRIKLFGMPSKHQPDLIYLRYVPLWKVHVFTLVQLTCLVLLWVIKASTAAVVFPMMVLALVFIRKLLDFFFTKRELSWLDDLIPESKKKKEDDKKKKAREKLASAAVFTEQEEPRPYTEESGELKADFEGSNLLDIPVKALSGSQEKMACVRVDVSPDSPGRGSTSETFL
ncbi:Sodium bicarbonate cotransporter 3 [Liparis tanakae]|uniref:Anion exchange protein n=1 Tax=Liparis tanakae TaxID=230148 RepID=A0A4Z2H2F4_9TELE|nr:Sodium bicarbonate cotransporter 3 [Liparis tanakae]